jgi:hypothetical protein
MSECSCVCSYCLDPHRSPGHPECNYGCALERRDTIPKAVAAELDRLRAENEMLRALLEEWLSGDDDPEGTGDPLIVRVREALKAKGT